MKHKGSRQTPDNLVLIAIDHDLLMAHAPLVITADAQHLIRKTRRVLHDVLLVDIRLGFGKKTYRNGKNFRDFRLAEPEIFEFRLRHDADYRVHRN